MTLQSIEALTPEHLRSLEVDSRIAAEVTAARGYHTAASGAAMARLGFSKSQCLAPSLILPIWGVTGVVAGYQARPDRPRMRKGKVVKYETMSGMKMVLDVHPSVRHLLGDPSVPLFVTEGVKKEDAVVSFGACAVGLLGVWNWRGTNDAGGKTALADWESIALNGRRVYIVFDSDVMLKREVHAALVRLKAFLKSQGAEVALIYLPGDPQQTKVGVDDFLASGHTLDDVIALATDEVKAPVLEAEDGQFDDTRKSQATILVELAGQAELFCDGLRDAYASFQFAGHRETWPVRSSGFRRWLAREFYLRTRSAANSSAIADALAVIEARAQFDGDERAVSLRVAEGPGGAVYIDLGGPEWNAVCVTPDGWTVVDDPPVHFRRSQMTRPLAHPIAGGSVELLRPFLSVPDEDHFICIVGWLLGALRPRGPYPLLAFVAEQGAGKSFTAEILRSLVDPAAVALRGMPREERDLVIAARSNHVIALDNVSSLPQWLSDALCRIATGAGWATRTLYTDSDEQVFSQSRPAILTGIEDFIANGDLLDRTMLVALRAIPEDQREQELVLWQRFDAVQPLIFGALLDAVAAALRNLPTVDIRALPRMADFAAWVTAGESDFGWAAGTFLAAYREGVAGANDVVLEGSLLAEPLRDCVACWGEEGWQGTASDLLHELGTRVDDETRRKKGWPKTARALSGQARRLAPTFRNVGVDITFDRASNSGRKRLITVRLKGAQITVQTVRAVQSDAGEVDDVDDRAYEMDGSNRQRAGAPECKADDVDGMDGELEPSSVGGGSDAWESEIP